MLDEPNKLKGKYVKLRTQQSRPRGWVKINVAEDKKKINDARLGKGSKVNAKKKAIMTKASIAWQVWNLSITRA